jgi:hypothetical protein
MCGEILALSLPGWKHGHKSAVVLGGLLVRYGVGAPQRRGAVVFGAMETSTAPGSSILMTAKGATPDGAHPVG